MSRHVQRLSVDVVHGVSEFAPSRRWRRALCLLVAVAACSTPSSLQEPEPAHGGGGVAQPTPTVAPSPSEVVAPPNPPNFTDPFDRLAYELAHSNCRLTGIARTAAAFEADRDDPRSVARAYAEGTLPGSDEHREATYRGCLDAFESLGP